MTDERTEERTKDRLPFLAAAAVVIVIALVGLFLWLPNHRQSATGTTDLGTQLIGGAVVAAAILTVQFTWERRVRKFQETIDQGIRDAEHDRQDDFNAVQLMRQQDFESAATARRVWQQSWDDRLVTENDTRIRQLTMLVLDLLLQTPLRHPGLDLHGFHLEGAFLANRNLVHANLTGALLIAADLTGANLTKTCLEGANLDGARLDGADLTGSNLRDAILSGASLAGATLAGADLTGAIVTEKTDFRAATADRHTVWPSNQFNERIQGIRPIVPGSGADDRAGQA